MKIFMLLGLAIILSSCNLFEIDLERIDETIGITPEEFGRVCADGRLDTSRADIVYSRVELGLGEIDVASLSPEQITALFNCP